MTLLSGDELADLVGLSPATIRRYARTGGLPAVSSPGGHRKYDRELALAALDAMRLGVRADVERPSAQLHDVGDESTTDLDIFDLPPTPRGPFIAAPTRVTVREQPFSSAPVMTNEEWNEFVEVLDASY